MSRLAPDAARRARRRRRRRRLWRRARSLFAVLLATVLLPGAAAAHPALPRAAAVVSRTPAASPGRFRPPVDGEVIDGWRPPATRYGPGNRGWEYATTIGEPVLATGDGTVAFAGQVGGTLHVTVAHRGGLRTTYSLLATVEVTVGRTVRAGDRLGTAGERLHFGARLASGYIDPGLLFRPGALRLRARLLPAARAHARPPVGSATITRRSALGQAICTGRTSAGRSRKNPAPGPPTVATRAGPGTSNRWEGDGNGRCQHEAVARGRRALRASDPPLEPEDEAIHPR